MSSQTQGASKETNTGASQDWLAPILGNSGMKTKTKTAPADGGGCLAPGPLIAPSVRRQCHLLARRRKPGIMFASSLNKCSFLPPPRQGTLCVQGRKMKDNGSWTSLSFKTWPFPSHVLPRMACYRSSLAPCVLTLLLWHGKNSTLWRLSLDRGHYFL